MNVSEERKTREQERDSKKQKEAARNRKKQKEKARDSKKTEGSVPVWKKKMCDRPAHGSVCFWKFYYLSYILAL